MIHVTITIPDDERLSHFLRTGKRISDRRESWAEEAMPPELRQILASAHVNPDGTISTVKAEAAPLYYMFVGTVQITLARPVADVGAAIVALAKQSAVAYR